MDGPIRVLIVDDHPVVVSGLRAGLAAQADIEVVDSAGSVADARQLLEERAIDVVLLDLRLPDGSGAELLSLSQAPDAPAFVVLSAVESPTFVDAALRLGASGFLAKTASVAELVDAVRSVHAGRAAIGARLLHAARAQPWEPLTGREHEVVTEIVRGRSNDEIAASLHLARKTVETYVSRLLERFEVASRTELAVRAEREGWLELPAAEARIRAGRGRRHGAARSTRSTA